MSMTIYSEETKELMETLVEDGGDIDDMKTFIENHGESQFNELYEEYLSAVDEYDEDVVTAFLEIFEIEDIGHLSECYYGDYRSGAEFAEQFATDCGDVSDNMPSWIEIDWQKSWDNNLSYDFHESEGHIFSNF